MLRLRPTTITITARELDDSERRSRYRKHLRTSQRISKRFDTTNCSEQDVTLSDTVGLWSRQGESHLIASDSDANIPSAPQEPQLASRQRSASDSGESIVRIHSNAWQRDGNGCDPEIEETPGTNDAFSQRLQDESDASSEWDMDFPTAAQVPTTPLGTDLSDSGDELAADFTSPARPATTSRDPRATISVAAEELDATLSSRHLSVYNDRLPGRDQPQTPRQLPEARHQSRFNGPYTAPAGGRRQRAEAMSTPVTGRRTRVGRNGSPTGLRTPGFQGLYGGSENVDDV
ncbi:hypothetical protein FZEAL_5965 [Fusarium zealandicum]|uniref:Uncharacterized protein n=1 Tax=Fusarium zealandicum TaxID=1053134 RepID=A0A8H4XKB8_9HYPO|nr:hypothetical protein FZEAL_5965 [Fusarium zealandicum]